MKRSKDTRPEEESLGEVLDFMRVLWAVHHAMQSASKRMNRTMGLTGPQRLVLRILTKRPGMTAGELARALHIDPSTLTGIIARLEARRLVKRDADENDARKVRLTLTPDGKREARDRPGTVESTVRDVLVELPPETLRRAKKTLQLLSDRLSGAEPT